MSDTAHIIAAQSIDWMQVVLNNGNVCFHLFLDGGHEHGRFCCRGTNWPGHLEEFGKPDHKFVSLADLMRKIADQRTVDGIALDKCAEALRSPKKQ